MRHVKLHVPAPQEGRQLGEAEALRIFLQIFQALEYCHRRCVGGCWGSVIILFDSDRCKAGQGPGPGVG